MPPTIAPDTVRARVRLYIQETFLYMRPDVALGDDDALLARGILDSLGMMELLEFLESEYQIQIGDGDVTEENLGSVNAIAGYVARH
jgi:acyl carrier protein